MKCLRLPTLAALVAFLAAFVLAPATTNAQPATTVPTAGTFTDALGGTGTFTGEFDVQDFQTQGGTLYAVGTLTGTLTDSAGNFVGSVTQTISIPVDLQQSNGSCEILNLVLGPLDLDLLGLQIHLDQVVLTITAEQGEGNLLGNLLCAVAGLLDPGPGGGLLDAIADLLNQILDGLNA